MHAASETCPFLAFSSFFACRYRTLLSSRFALLLCDTLKQRQPAAHERQEAVRFRRIAPYGAWTRQPARPHVQPPVQNFYPRPPRGGRQQKQRENTLLLSHYTPLCTNCKEMLANQTAKSHRYLRKRLVFRCEASRKTMCAADSHWPDIKRSARCLGQILGAVQRARPWSGSCCLAGRTADCPRQGRSGRSALL